MKIKQDTEPSVSICAEFDNNNYTGNVEMEIDTTPNRWTFVLNQDEALNLRDELTAVVEWLKEKALKEKLDRIKTTGDKIK